MEISMTRRSLLGAPSIMIVLSGGVVYQGAV